MIILLFLIFPFISFSISLYDAERLAVKNFYEIKKKEREIEIKNYELKQKISEFFPKINVSASYNIAKEQKFTIETPFFTREFSFIKDRFRKIEVLINQKIFDLFSIKEIKNSSIKRKIKKLEYEITALEIKKKIREIYINALKLKALLKVYEAQEKRIKEHLKNVEELYKEGYVAYKDILETKVKLYEVKTKISEIEGNYKKLLNTLSFLTGVNVENVEEPKVNVEKGSIFENPKFKIAKAYEELSKNYVETVKASFFPIFDVSFIYQNTTESDVLPENRFFISLSLKWNFLGGRKFYELKKARKNLLIANEEKKKVLKELETELKNTLIDIEVAKKELETAKERLKEAKENYRLALEKYKEGLGTNADVLDAEAYLTLAEENLKIQEYKLLRKKLKLMEVYGK